MKLKILCFCILILLSSTLSSQNRFEKIDQFVDSIPTYSNTFDGLFKTLDFIDNRFTYDIEKTRLVYIWIINNFEYDYVKMNHTNLSENEYSNLYGDSKIERIKYVLKYRKGICGDFANLFQVIGDYLSIDIGYISGYARTRNSKISDDSDSINHAWNYITIKNRNYIIDVTWGDGTNYSKDRYFMIPPEKMIYTHFPEESDFQFINQEITLNDFVNMPYVYPKYYEERSIIEFYPKKNITLAESKLVEFGIKISKLNIKKYNIILEKNDTLIESTKNNQITSDGFIKTEYLINEDDDIDQLKILLIDDKGKTFNLIRYDVKKTPLNNTYHDHRQP